MAVMDGNADVPKTASDKAELNERKALDDPFVGTVLNERYQINELIGVGGWGNVYRATHLAFEQEVAVKIVHRHHLQHEDNVKRFKREARALHKIECESVVKVIDADILPAPYIVLELFDGEPLSKWIEQHGPMNSYMAIDLFVQLCNGLSAAAALKIVHRDLKPANILLKVRGKNIEAKILDFGLAKFMDHQSTGGAKAITATGDILGSPPYMSPEQWKGQTDARSDIYALGCIMYEVLAGKPAFSAQYGLDYLHKHLSEKPKPIAEVYPQADLPPGLEEIVSTCMAKSPERRYQTSELCARDLQLVANGAMPENFPATIYSVTKANKSKLIPAAIICVLFGAFVVLPMVREMSKPVPAITELENKMIAKEQLASSTFPQEWAGYWGGTLTMKSNYDWQNKAPRPAFAEGQSGMTIFNFVKGSDFMYHKPPTIFFKSESSGFSQNLNSVPTIKLGNLIWTKPDGSSHNEVVLGIKVLKNKQGEIQEDTSKEIEHHAPGALDTKYYSLVISRIKESSPGSLNVQIERIQYGADQVVRTRQVMEGTLTRDWQSYANAICQQTRRKWENVIKEFDI